MEGSTRSSKSSPSCCAEEGAREGRRAGTRQRTSVVMRACACVRVSHRVDLGQLRHLRAGQHAQREVHLLQVCAAAQSVGAWWQWSARQREQRHNPATTRARASASAGPEARRESRAAASAREDAARSRASRRQLRGGVAAARPAGVTHAPLVPVTELMLRGRVRMSKMTAFCSQGTRKCVPSEEVCGSTPFRRSNSTACSPPSTAESVPHTAGFRVCAWARGATQKHARQAWQLRFCVPPARNTPARVRACLCTWRSAPASRPRPGWLPSAPRCPAAQRARLRLRVRPRRPP
jgi:hypothetical protein